MRQLNYQRFQIPQNKKLSSNNSHDPEILSLIIMSTVETDEIGDIWEESHDEEGEEIDNTIDHRV